MAPPRGKPQAKLNALMFALFLEQLTEGPSTAKELMGHTGLHERTIYALLIALRKRHVVHIAAWEPDAIGRKTVKVYALGPGRDADKPRKSQTQAQRDWRARKAMAPLRMTVNNIEPAISGVA